MCVSYFLEYIIILIHEVIWKSFEVIFPKWKRNDAYASISLICPISDSLRLMTSPMRVVLSISTDFCGGRSTILLSFSQLVQMIGQIASRGTFFHRSASTDSWMKVYNTFMMFYSCYRITDIVSCRIVTEQNRTAIVDCNVMH